MAATRRSGREDQDTHEVDKVRILAIEDGCPDLLPWIDMETGETVSPYNVYGELKPMPVRGVQALSKLPNGSKDAPEYIPLITRLFNWTIRKSADALDLKSEAPWTCVNNCTDVSDRDHFLFSAIANNSYRGPPVYN